MDRLPLDHALNDQFVAALKADIPALESASIQEERGGVFTMTMDGRLMVGPANGVRGFWMATGCNGTGFASRTPTIGTSNAFRDRRSTLTP